MLIVSSYFRPPSGECGRWGVLARVLTLPSPFSPNPRSCHAARSPRPGCAAGGGRRCPNRATGAPSRPLPAWGRPWERGAGGGGAAGPRARVSASLPGWPPSARLLLRSPASAVRAPAAAPAAAAAAEHRAAWPPRPPRHQTFAGAGAGREPQLEAALVPMTLPNSSCVVEDKMCEGNKTTIANPQLMPLVVFLSAISLVTVGLNLLVLYAVRSERKLHTVGNLYIVSLSVADLIVGAVVMPMNILYLLMSRWSLGHPLCLFWLSMDYVASTASIFSVFILCIDRYRSVQQPLRYLKYRTKTRASATILGAWFLSFLWVIPILGWHHFMSPVSGHREDKCETDFYDVTWFKIMTAIINFYLPTLLMLWFYAKIYKAVRQHCQHRELINGSLPSFSEIKLKPENPKVGAKKPGKESPWEVLKRKSKDASGEPVMKPPSQDSEEMKCPGVFSQEEDKEMDKLHCFPLNIMQMQTEAEGSGRSYVAINQSQGQLEIDEQSLRMRVANEISEDQILGDSQSFSRTDSDTPPESASGKSKPRSGSSTGLDYIKYTWKRLRSHSRQYVSGLHMNRERKAAKQLGFIMAAFILCWIPYFIFFMVIAFCKSCCNEHVHMFTIWLGYINSTLNPLIYPLCNENFKKTFKKILHIRS